MVDCPCVDMLEGLGVRIVPLSAHLLPDDAFWVPTYDLVFVNSAASSQRVCLALESLLDSLLLPGRSRCPESGSEPALRQTAQPGRPRPA